jgi:site-specific recombinase XerD
VRRFVIREFSDAAEEFLEWAKMEYWAHPNSHRRIATSLTSAKKFFAQQPVGTIYESEIEAYKVWRVTEHEVRDITLRHDLHALSTFFQYAIKKRWARENPTHHDRIARRAVSGHARKGSPDTCR